MGDFVCPRCDADVGIPEGCRYGGSFIAPCCGEKVKAVYDRSIDISRDSVTEWWALIDPEQGDET